MKPSAATWLAAAVIAASFATAADIQSLEARLKDHLADSPEAAELMLALLAGREAAEDVFGVVKTASDFVRAQTKHPQRAAVMVRLIDGYAAGARHADVLTTGKQFFEIFPDSPLATRAHRPMAEAAEKLGQWHDAASHRAAVALAGDAVAARQALELFRRAENAQAGREGAEFTEALLRKFPSADWTTAAALRGIELARRAERWETGAEIARLALKNTNARNEGDTATLWFRLGELESRLGRHKEAAAAMQKSLTTADSERRGAHLRELAAAKADAATIGRQAREIVKLFPATNTAHYAAIQACDAWLAAGKPADAITFIEAVITGGDFSRDLVRKYLEACGQNHARAVQFLSARIGKHPSNDPVIREALAVDLYQLRLRDSAKSRKTAIDWLEKSPSATAAGRIVSCLIDQAADESTVKADLAAITRSALRHPHIKNYWTELWRWRGTDPQRNRLIENAKRKFEGNEIVRLWQRTEKGGHDGARACEELLAKNPDTESKRVLMLRIAHLYRHEMGDKFRPKAHDHYKACCNAFPKDWQTAELWLEAAGHAGDQAKLEAARHLIAMPPAAVHPDTRVRVVEAGDAGHRRKAAQWAAASANLGNSPFQSSGRIGRLLHDAGLKEEARKWWRTQYGSAPADPGASECLVMEAETLEPDEAIALLRPAIGRQDAVHGPLTMALADRYFRKGDFTTFAGLLEKTRALADKQPFREWHVGEWPARGWLDHTTQSAGITDPDKALVYRAIFDLRLGRVSAEAGVLWAALQEPSWQRVTETQRAMRMSDRHHDAWQRLYPRAGNAIIRRDMTLAAAILNGLIHSIGGVGEKDLEKARARLRTAYANMGSLGTDIPEDSPVSPLIEIVLHLRLGDMAAAEDAYFKRRELFDKHIAELPVELLLFAAGTHIDLGTEADHQRAEELLRGWIIKNAGSDQVGSRDKARAQLLLAKNYLTSRNYDVARSEYTTLINLYPKEPEAIDAKFGIGETFMAQGIEDQAGEIFADLATRTEPRVVIRANFMRGLLAIGRDEPEEARSIFLGILEKVPEIELADSTLYHLAEVYGIEQRYLAQLETLRTVGRLGRESQRWLTPGKALAVVVQDPDLGISRGEMRLPVRVVTEPGGDVEDAYLTSGGAGRGIFLADIPSMLGPAKPGDGILQVTGGDLIRVDYPDEFKARFKNQVLEGTRIRIATDGILHAASNEITNQEETSFTENLRRQDEPEDSSATLSEQRPSSQVKPGNLIHVRVSDGDQDTTAQPDEVAIKLQTSSGDIVRVPLAETSAHGGIFTGTIRTGELPAGAQAGDAALDHSPLMAIDQRRETSWRSEPDGKAPKLLSVDLKEPKPVEHITLESPNADQESPAALSLHGSQDGRFWVQLAQYPPPETHPLPPAAGEGMMLRTFKAPMDAFQKNFEWNDLVKMLQSVEPDEQQAVDVLSWEPPPEGGQMHLVVWSGPLVQTRSGAMRFSIGGTHTALMFNGRLELPFGPGARTVDVLAEKGVHDLVIVSVVPSGKGPASANRARENRGNASVTLSDFVASDFDLTYANGLEKITRPIGGTLVRDGAVWSVDMPPLELRHLKWRFDAFSGAGVAVNHITVSGGGATHIPTTRDVLELAGNNTLELAPGDSITVSYLDEVGADGKNRNRLLTRELTATYADGRITPITYAFHRGSDGSVGKQRHELLRIEPGDRIVAEVTDYDLDRTLDRDKVEIEVEAPDGTRFNLTATETGPTTGVFVTEVETSAKDGDGPLKLAAGDRVTLRYRDEQNNFPGHSYVREAVVIVNQPGDASIRVIASSALPGQAPALTPEVVSQGPGEVSLKLPLTVEVIDPDRALHTGSRVIVEVETTQGNKVELECVLSSAHSAVSQLSGDSPNPALLAGRFVGQLPLELGDLKSPKTVPRTELATAPGIGRIIPPEEEENTSGIHVLNVAGNDQVTARYADERRPSGEPARLEAAAVFRTAGTLAVLDENYELPATELFLGKRLHIQIEDPDLDITNGRDTALVRVISDSGEDEMLELTETLSHSGIFNASFPLVAARQPARGNPDAGVECFFGDTLRVGYLDNVMQKPDGTPLIELSLPVAMGADGTALAFSKNFRNEELAIQTRFHIAECHFELFKSHRALERNEEAAVELQAGRRTLRELSEDFPDPKHQPGIHYLLGQFAQEQEDWNEAITSYQIVFRNHPRHPLAPEALYKLGQCHEEAGQLDEALENYATLAATYPKSPLISNVMLRISEHFYQQENFPVAASVGRKFLERFPTHEWAPRMAFRVGQALYKNEAYRQAAEAFDAFTKRFPDEELTSQGLFWAGESHRMAGNIPAAFQRYNRCRWDFPESEAAKYSRGRLALPELLSEFDRQADLGD
ncbi:MAG: tetratricopeptide repeat protein [Luteolibacter sp.]